ncbi:hypothetical protein ISCGN_017604 [Ixodes scapularis]
MPRTCVAVNCTERYKKGSRVSFHKFPADSERHRRWIISVDRKEWSPRANDRLCGKHFFEGRCGFHFNLRPKACLCAGKPSSDRDHPDFVPTVFTQKAPAKRSWEGMGLLLGSRACPECEVAMTPQVRARSADGYSCRCGVWMTRELPKKKPVKAQCRGEVSVRSGFFFEGSHLTLPQLMKIIYLWCQNLPCAVIQRETDVANTGLRAPAGDIEAEQQPRGC